MPKPKSVSPATPVGVAWYRPGQWETLRNLAVDKDNLEMTYAEWLKEAERVIKQFRQQGFYLVKVDVEISELLLWCESRKIPLNGEARARYAQFKAQQLSR